MSAREARVFVVDDDGSVRLGLARLLSAAGWNVEAFSSARELLRRVPFFSGAGCAVLDVRMPEMTGPELYDRLRETGSSLAVIFLTGYGDVPTSVQAMKRGAVDFLLKPVDGKVLLGTVGRAIKRQRVQQIRQSDRRSIALRLGKLSPREREVMEYVIGGSLNKQIAAQLGIAEKTVKVHRHEVMDKMGVRSVAGLVRLCDAAGIRPRTDARRRSVSMSQPR